MPDCPPDGSQLAPLPGSTGRVMSHAHVRRLRADRRGSIAIMAALSVILLAGAGAMALDLAQIYLTRSSNQRIADQSALAAAFAYEQSSNSATTAQNAASSLAIANGASGSTVVTAIVNSPANDGNKAAQVTVTTPVSLTFGRAITASAQNLAGLMSVNVTATAYAEIESKVTPCITALGSSGVAATGGTSLTATGCAVASDGGVVAASGPTITAEAIYAVGSISPSSCSGTGACVQSSPTGGQLFPGSSAPVDPYASAGVFSRMSTVADMTAGSFSMASAPSGGTTETCPGSSLPAGSYNTITTTYYPVCSTISFTGGAGTITNISGLQLGGPGVTFNFGPGTYNINGISIPSSTPVTINMTGSPTINVWAGVSLGGSSSLTVNGAATYYVQGGIKNGSAGSLTFSNASGSAFYVAGGIDIGNGPGTFPSGTYVITSGDSTGAGIDVNGGSTATFGSGSFAIAGGINVGGGGSLTIGGALNANSVFQIPSVDNSGYAIETGGGSTLDLGCSSSSNCPGFTNFDINGPMLLQGNVYLGSGAYTINGALDAGSAGGCCIVGTDVSIVTSGAITFGAGYSTISLTAPSTITGATQGTASTVVLASESSSASTIAAGASNTSVVGAVYIPNAALTLSGAGNLSGGGGCLQVVTNGISLAGSGAISTSCASLGSSATSGSGSVALVQ